MDTSKFEVIIAPLGTLKDYTYTVNFCRYNGKWLYCRAKNRDVFETAGGTIERGEAVLDAAKRELYEETGAIQYKIAPAFDYSVRRGESTDFTHGQVFVVEIHELGNMPDFEMAEVKAFDTIPDKMRFPEILPVLFRNVQGWLTVQKSKQEIWDVYDGDRNLTGRTHRRGKKLPTGDYHLIAIILLQNSKGEFLIVRRSPLITAPLVWNFPGGSAVAGDDSRITAVKELQEETGLIVAPEDGKLILSHKSSNGFFDIWHFKQDFNINDVVLQEGETIDAKSATVEEIRLMVKSGEMYPSTYLDEVFSKLPK
ncbi:MAG: NUDIX domain-containing protein [Defluviitaleaceae bacterium]|nr:NUDIX domain-containing protein [Defluviitaleaceae bacterium]